MTKKGAKKKTTRKSVSKGTPVKKAATRSKPKRPIPGGTDPGSVDDNGRETVKRKKNRSSITQKALRQKVSDLRALDIPDHIIAITLNCDEDDIEKFFGRPKCIIDYEEVRRLYALECVDREVAAKIRVSPRTIARLKVEDPAFIEAMDLGLVDYILKIREAQDGLLGGQNPAMAIFLGKSKLGQSDRPDEELPREFSFTVKYDEKGADNKERHRKRRAAMDSQRDKE